MIFSTLIFFPENFHKIWLNSLQNLVKRAKITPVKSVVGFRRKKLIVVCVAVYVLIQVLLPLRCFLGPVSTLFWHEEGMRFSWRVMLMHKEAYATFYVKDSRTNREIQIRNEDFLTLNQEDQMATQPDMIKQYADYLYKTFKDSLIQTSIDAYRLTSPSIHAQIYASLNGRPSQLFLSKEHALQEKKYTFAPHNWLAAFNPSW